MKQVLVGWVQNKIEQVSFIKYYKEIVYFEWLAIFGLTGWIVAIFFTILH